MPRTVLFIHGAWLTPALWAPWQAHVEARGYLSQAPAWPGLERPIVELQQNQRPELGQLTLGRIVAHYAAIIDTLPEPPILIGHSYGGLIVQMLLDRGLGAAAVSIDPAPAAGILPGFKALRAALPVFLSWRGWQRALTMSFASFARDFANGLPEADQRRAYDHYVVPAPGRLYYQSVLGLGSGINWSRPDRAPLLLLSGEDDRTVEPFMVRQQAKRYAASPAETEMKLLPGRSHFLIAAPGWADLADIALEWVEARIGRP